MLPKRHWHEMTTVDFSSSKTSDWIAILPVCAIEQHGPHLPVYTDTAIAEGHIRAVVAKLPAHVPATFLPVQAIGKSNEHIASPGTLTLSAETLIRAWTEIGDSVARAGVRKMVLVNSHGGNVPMLDIVARELRVRHGMLCVATSWSRFGQPKGLYSEWEGKYGIHGGDMETSVMLALRPDLVKMEHAAKFHSAQERFEQRFKHLRGHGTSQFGWVAQDLGPDGTVGDASIATADKGRASIEHMSSAFVELLEDVHAFDMNDLFKPGASFR